MDLPRCLASFLLEGESVMGEVWSMKLEMWTSFTIWEGTVYYMERAIEPCLLLLHVIRLGPTNGPGDHSAVLRSVVHMQSLSRKPHS
jgi:hypothetical protein